MFHFLYISIGEKYRIFKGFKGFYAQCTKQKLTFCINIFWKYHIVMNLF